jgi:signal transduction histidine kinase/ligand-binding sensor domain-containing protein
VKKHIVVIVVLLIFAKITFGQLQQFAFQSYPITNVGCVFQDSKGFVWIGTANGLFRYNGNDFQSFDDIKNKNYKPSDNRVWSFAEDGDHNIWIATQTGICYYNPLTLKITDVPVNGNEQFFSGAAYSDNNGTVYFGTSKMGVLRVIKNKSTPTGFELEMLFQVTNDTINLKSKQITSLFSDNKNKLWAVATDGSFYQLNKSNTFTKIKSDNSKKHNSFFIEQTHYIKDKNSVIALAVTDPEVTETGFFEIKINDDSLLFHDVETPPELKSILGLRFAFDLNKKFWLIAEGQKPIRLDIDFRNDYLTLSNILFTSNQPVERLNYKETGNSKVAYFDGYNRLWFATDKSLLQLNLNHLKMQQCGKYGDELGKINFKNCDVINYDSTNDMLLATSDDLIIQASPNGSYLVNKLNNKNNLGIYQLYKDANNDLYLATINGLKFIPAGLLSKPNTTISISACSALALQKEIDGVANNKLCSTIKRTTNNTLIFNSSNELFEINSKRNKIEKLYFTDAINVALIRCIEDLDNYIFIGTDDKLYVYDKSKKVGIDITKLSKDFNLLNDKYIAVLFKSTLGNLFIGTNKGLYHYNATSKKIKLISPSDFTIKAIIEDTEKDIWLAVQGKGVYKWHAKTNQLSCFNNEDGLFSNTFSESGSKITLLPNGALVLLTSGGLNYFFPNSLVDSALQNNLQLIEIEVNNKSVLLNPDSVYQLKLESVLQKKQLALSPSENTLNITIGNIISCAPHKIKYQIKLDGFDKDWVDYKNYEAIYYKELPPYRYSYFFPGSYPFLVKLMLEEQSKEIVTQLLTVKVNVNFRNSIEFYTLIGFILLVILVYIVRYYAQLQLREKLREQEKLLAIERERNRISEDLHDDLGAGLSSIAMMTAVMKDLITEEESKETAEEVAVEANELVGRMREIIWSMNSKNDTIENLISYLHEYCNKYLIKNKMELVFNLQGDVPQQDILGDKRENIFLVVKETLHNAVKYAETKKITITINLNPDTFNITIFDHGKGFDMNNIKRFGNGLENMKQRIQKVNGTCNIESAPGKGTLTRISIPI